MLKIQVGKQRVGDGGQPGREVFRGQSKTYSRKEEGEEGVEEEEEEKGIL